MPRDKKRVDLCVTSMSFPNGETFPVEITFANPFKGMSREAAEAEYKRIKKAIERTVRRLGYKPDWIPVI